MTTLLDSRSIFSRYASTRRRTTQFVRRLAPEDCVVQTMADVSPTKWHLGHTTWFFENFVLRDHLPGYQVFREGYGFLFNSYYEAVGDRQARPSRGLSSRPTLEEILEYREYVDAGVGRLLYEKTHDIIRVVGVTDAI